MGRTGWFRAPTRDCVSNFSQLASEATRAPRLGAWSIGFAKPPTNKKDLHRPLRAGDDLEDAFAWKEERTLSQALTLQYDKVMFILQPSEQAKAVVQPARNLVGSKGWHPRRGELNA